ncbi:hypothetical protein LMG6871_04309 [Ralstonia edaphis]|uniref:GIY-YIG nuclease family protein n=1 Tax=Ralstonia edaphi TaxID=3058599 RepID=UPI0028F4F5A7|nr:GIY-YIG nuclease family protein [Ralstonia sp. LMG 6871]CAJ0720886.1 hypothetical protein LMG6871_04309 [Ralstonia sp. LMG 6871]
MSAGYLYILSNAFLAPGLLKIGFSMREPVVRANALSRSTAIPGPFRVEFSMLVNDCKVAERRLHLLLREHRVDKNKEFFRLSLPQAITTCTAIGTFEQEERPAADSVLVHPDFCFSKVCPCTDYSVIKALMHVLGATQHNSRVDHVLLERLLVVDGFTSARTFAKFRNSQVQSASIILRRFAGVAKELTYSLPNEVKPISLFVNFVYDKGHAAWTFRPEFRRLFIVPTTI